MNHKRKIPKIRRRYAITKPHRPSRRQTLDETIERDAAAQEPPQKIENMITSVKDIGSASPNIVDSPPDDFLVDL